MPANTKGWVVTKKERQIILKAIDYFLDQDPDKWINGIDELYLLVYKISWSEHTGLDKIKRVSIPDLLANHNTLL